MRRWLCGVAGCSAAAAAAAASRAIRCRVWQQPVARMLRHARSRCVLVIRSGAASVACRPQQHEARRYSWCPMHSHPLHPCCSLPGGRRLRMSQQINEALGKLDLMITNAAAGSGSAAAPAAQQQLSTAAGGAGEREGQGQPPEGRVHCLVGARLQGVKCAAAAGRCAAAGGTPGLRSWLPAAGLPGHQPWRLHASASV